MDVGLKLNPMFFDGAAKQHDNDLGLNPDEYIENFADFFKYYALDMNELLSLREEITEMINEQSIDVNDNTVSEEKVMVK